MNLFDPPRAPVRFLHHVARIASSWTRPPSSSPSSCGILAFLWVWGLGGRRRPPSIPFPGDAHGCDLVVKEGRWEWKETPSSFPWVWFPFPLWETSRFETGIPSGFDPDPSPLGDPPPPPPVAIPDLSLSTHRPNPGQVRDVGEIQGGSTQPLPPLHPEQASIHRDDGGGASGAGREGADKHGDPCEQDDAEEVHPEVQVENGTKEGRRCQPTEPGGRANAPRTHVRPRRGTRRAHPSALPRTPARVPGRWELPRRPTGAGAKGTGERRQGARRTGADQPSHGRGILRARCGPAPEEALFAGREEPGKGQGQVGRGTRGTGAAAQRLGIRVCAEGELRPSRPGVPCGGFLAAWIRDGLEQPRGFLGIEEGLQGCVGSVRRSFGVRAGQ
eukprot:scaffold598_cov318-Pavlova_lutheri.AAC.26